jgi:hypothetical protein
MNKTYEIRDYSHQPGWIHYVSEATESVDEGWTAAVPIGKKLKATPPKRFSSKSEAQPYLDAIKALRAYDWAENSHFYKSRGFMKPSWKIYEVENTRPR